MQYTETPSDHFAVRSEQNRFAGRVLLFLGHYTFHYMAATLGKVFVEAKAAKANP